MDRSLVSLGNLVPTTLQIRGEVSTSWCAAAGCMFLLTVATVAGNVAVIQALKKATPRFPTHYPLASLAAADFMLGAFVLPLSAARELFIFRPYWPICAFWSTMDVFCCTASILSLCTLGWERWSGITSPLSRARRFKRARLFSYLIWPVAAAVALPTAFIPSPSHHPVELVKACTVNTNIGYVFFSVSFSFYLPASGMTFLYARILLALAAPNSLSKCTHRGRGLTPRRNDPEKEPDEVAGDIPLAECRTPAPTKKSTTFLATLQKTITRTPLPAAQQKTKEEENNNEADVYLSPKGCHLDLPTNSANAIGVPSPLKTCASPGGIIPRQRRATQTIVMLMSLFLICWAPFFIMLPIDSLCDCVPDVAWVWCTWFGYMNSALDPLVYAAASPTVRRALHASLTFTSSSKFRARNLDIPVTPNVRRRI